MTGYPSIDKPWLKYYSEEAINAPLPEKTMWQYVYENNKDYPNDIVFRYFGTKITYGDFFVNVKRVACSFVAMGVAKDDMVTIMSMHTPETIYCIYALNYIGAVANLVYITLSEKEILDTIENTNSKMFLALDPATERIAHIRKDIHIPVVLLSVADSMPFVTATLYRMKNKVRLDDVMSFRDFLKQGEESELPAESTEHETTAVIVYTSGTTGEPKGVMLSDDGMNAHAFQDMNGLFSFKRQLTMLFILPPFLGFGISHLHTYIAGGIDLTLQIQLVPEMVAKTFYKNVPDAFITGPSLLDAITMEKYDKKDLSNLKFLVGGGADIKREKEVYINNYLKSHNSTAKYSCGYGMTETAATLSANCNEISKLSSVGIPFFMTNVKAVDTNIGKELGYEKEGELSFSTPNMMLGYFQNENATEEMLYQDDVGTTWIRTGDLGYIDKDGFVYVTGRIKRICPTKVKDGSFYKLIPQRIEELFLKDSDIKHCGVITCPDEKRINVAVAFVTIRDKGLSQEKRDAIRTRLFELSAVELPEHEQPVDIIIIDSMPLTPSGKIDYRALEKKNKTIKDNFFKE